LLPAKAYLEYSELVLKHYGIKPRVEEIQTQADALINLVQKLLEKEDRKEDNHDSN